MRFARWFRHLFGHDWEVRNARARVAVCRYCKAYRPDGWS